IPLGTSQQMLDPIRRIIAIDLGDLPAVFPLHRAQQAPQIRPGPPPCLPPRKPGTNPSLHLRQGQYPFPHSVNTEVGWRRAWVRDDLHSSTLQNMTWGWSQDTI